MQRPHVKQRIWLDLTDLKDWDGPLSGIQRTQVAYIERFRAAFGEQVQGFVYQRGPDRFVPTSLALEGDATRVGTASEAVPFEEHAPARQRLRAAVRRIPGLARLARRVRRATSAVGEPAAGPIGSRIPFRNGDVVGVLGGNWLEPGYAELLAEARASVDVTLAHMVYDLIPILYPQWASPGGADRQRPYMRTVLAAADVIPCISESTARDVTRFLAAEGVTRPGRSEPSVIRLGTEPIAEDGVAQVPPGIDPERPFILSVGTMEIRKNHGLLYQAYSLAARRGIRLPPLYITGRMGWLAESTLHLLTTDPEVSPNVRIMSSTSDRELAWLYEHARIVVFPSFVEGWGLPIGEAAAYGKVCITSPDSSMPEVAGEYADYVSPFDPAALLERLTFYLDDGVLAAREREIAAGFVPRTWDDAFADLVAALGLETPPRP